MQVSIVTTAIKSLKSPVLIAGLFSDAVTQPVNLETLVDAAILADFKAKPCQTLTVYPKTGSIERIVLVGLGEQASCTLDTVRCAAGTGVRVVTELGLSALAIPLWKVAGIDPQQMAQTLVEGLILGSYTFNELKSEPKTQALAEISLVATTASKAAATHGAAEGQIIAESVCLARNLSNLPANYLTPTMLADIAERVAAEVGLRAEVLGEAQMAELGMGAILGVAQGSDEEAKFVILEHNAGRSDLPAYVVVGKGINFDSGGIQIKGAEGMGAMKGDMSGAADTLAILRNAALLSLPLHVVGLIPCTENLPDGRAYKPGDVLKSMSGITIEVISTDAEGRLILADALTYAKRYEPRAVVDLATLTGACVIALGTSMAALLSNNPELTGALKAAAAETGEKVWELPLEPEYEELIDSDIADIMNVGGRPAGTITGGLFLGRFAKEFPWAHLDIAGKELSPKTSGYTVKGGTGYGVRLVTAWLRAMAANK
ncbi:MAG: leucyl aminopeptidase [Chloroflexi bacterium]|nr:leucyl aminopeptidase [Chloroflexota bacterium]